MSELFSERHSINVSLFAGTHWVADVDVQKRRDYDWSADAHPSCNPGRTG